MIDSIGSANKINEARDPSIIAMVCPPMSARRREVVPEDITKILTTLEPIPAVNAALGSEFTNNKTQARTTVASN